MAQPWYTYPQDSPGGGYGQIIDPVCQNGSCHYLKPDDNFAIPAGVPITALLPGTITDVSNKGAGGGGLSVTERLDTPLNSLAKYVSYNYLGNATVSPGQSIAAGQQIGVAGSPTGINFALALGSDPSWGGPGFAQNAVGNPLLDPRPLVASILAGKIPTSTGSTTSVNTGNPVIDSALNAVLPQIKTWAEYAAIFLIALILIILGFVLLGGAPALQAAKKAVTA